MCTSIGRDVDGSRAACTNHFFGAPSIFLGQTWADDKGKLATCRHRADSGGETVKNVHLHTVLTHLRGPPYKRHCYRL